MNCLSSIPMLAPSGKDSLAKCTNVLPKEVPHLCKRRKPQRGACRCRACGRTWARGAIRCGNGSCRWIVPMVVPFGAVSMDARPAGIRHDQARGPSAEHAPGATTARLPLSEGPASSTPSV